MAQMIPDEMPPGRSLGERRLFARLQDLPDACLVYWEPAIGNRYPDFVVVMPDADVLLVEVKGWRAHQILGGDSQGIHTRTNPDCPAIVHQHPLRQARDYMFTLMDRCQRHPACTALLHADGPRTGKFLFPFGLCVVMTQMTDAEMRTHVAGDLRTIFPESSVVTADEFDAWSTLTPDALHERLRTLFATRWSFTSMNDAQLNALRAVIHRKCWLLHHPRNSPRFATSCNSPSPDSRRTN